MKVNYDNKYVENWWSGKVKRAYLELSDIQARYGNKLKTPTFDYPWDMLDWLRRFKKAMKEAGTPWSPPQTYKIYK